MLTLAACQSLPPPNPDQPPSADAAATAEQSGQHLLAAREYDRLAQSAPPPQRQEYQLKAIDILISGGQIAEARTRMPLVNIVGLGAGYAARKQILQARIAIAEGKSDQAVRLLNQAEKTRGLEPAMYSDIYRVRAQAEAQLGNIGNAVRNFVQREKYLVAEDALKENHQQLWALLIAQDRAALAKERALTRDAVAADWMDLALTVLNNPPATPQLAVALDDWKKAHANHPALATIFPALVSSAPGIIGSIRKIALLLPLTSDYGSAAQAVRDGFVAMDAANANPEKAAVQIYDLGADPNLAPTIYAQAVSEGAQFIVGPLGVEAAEQVAKRADLSVPTLLLSHVEALKDNQATETQVFQFGLPPEQEAIQAADRAYLDGRRYAAVLYPNSNWGQRLANAFETHWQNLGGIVSAKQMYALGTADYSETIKQLLDVGDSEARAKALETRLRSKVKFEPRRRDDVDMVFLAADGKHGRLIKPQLNYFRASQVPVYATSAIFAGKPDAVGDADLDGILFGDMPWMLLHESKLAELRTLLQTGWPHAQTFLDRLFALGVDAYAIIPQLNRLRADPSLHFNGVTSGLSLDASGRLHRQLLWARFRRGEPQVIDTFFKQNIYSHLFNANGTANATANGPGKPTTRP